jgi:hypothetical protein
MKKKEQTKKVLEKATKHADYEADKKLFQSMMKKEKKKKKK